MAIEASFTFLFNIAAIMIGATIGAYVTRLAKQPVILGYVLAGAIMGPLALNIISSQAEMLALAELGIAFLLFGAGIEIDFGKLKGVGLVSFFAALLQVIFTFAAGFFASASLGLNIIEALYIGGILAFSSTMVVIKILGDTHSINSLHGRLMIGMLIAQDLLIIVFIALVTNIGSLSQQVVIQTMLNGLGLVGIAFIANKFIFPSLLKFAATSEELLFLTAVGTAFIFMDIASFLGFSIAIGAFIAGIALSGFEYNVEIDGQIRSLRDFFSTIFFVALGLQIGLLSSAFLNLTLWFLIIVLVFKPLITGFILYTLGYDGRTSTYTGFGLSQVSEFSFILAATGLAAGQLSPDLFSIITIVTIITITLTPYSFRHGLALYNILSWPKRTLKFETPSFFRRRMPHEKLPEAPLKNHIIILGSKRMGNRIIAALHEKLPMIVVDHDPDRINTLAKQGIYCIYGDVYNERVIQKTNIRDAIAVISTVHDKEITESIVKLIRKQNQHAIIIARADHTKDAVKLYELGCDIAFIPELYTGRKVAQYLSEIFLGEFEARSRNQIRDKLIKNLIDALDFKQDRPTLEQLKKIQARDEERQRHAKTMAFKRKQTKTRHSKKT
ncbi:MAG: cation:proton antiporter [DPANN group archaeon]|nr:cation:proton antiporter [DPANN group archaeon]